MIIHSLTAHNLLKYRYLELSDLPTKGILAISGYNESGKSSIGEAVCFALFGRTFAVKPNEIQKLIRWGEVHCSVSMEFRLQDGELYRLTRSLDRDHNHSARLSKVDEVEQTIARGKETVAETLQELLGYEFDAFIDSFYLAQREITTPHPHGHAIHAMAGITPLTWCNKELQEEIIHDQTTLENLAKRNAQLKTQINDLAFDSQRAHVLTADQANSQRREQDICTAQQNLIKADADYQKHKTNQETDKIRKIIFLRLRLLMIIIALLSLSIWSIVSETISYAPVTVQILDVVKNKIEPSWLWYIIIGSLLIYIWSWIQTIILENNIKTLRVAGKRLADTLAALDELEFGLPQSLRLEPVPGRKSRVEPELRIQFRHNLVNERVTAQDVQEAVARDLLWIEHLLNRISKYQFDLKQELKLDTERRQMLDNLTNMSHALKTEEIEIQYRIQLRNYACELLQGAIRHLSRRFNHHLRGLAGRTLPMFTENRYQHLQIDEDLTVRAFSNEKRDFMELDEVSSGTQRQIMLALRLSMSQQLVSRVVRGRQFIFLDEPFAFFDEQRTRSALAILPRLSDDITQIWIVAQEFPKDLDFAKNICCRRDCDDYRDTALQE